MIFNIAYASENVDQFIMNVNRLIINPIIALLFALALAYFLWGVLQFLANAANDEKKTDGKKHMLWGVIGLVIMMGVFAFINLILSTFNITNVNPDNGTIHLDPYNPTYPPNN